MLDLRYIRENKERVRQKMTERGQTHDLDGLLQLDEQRRRLTVQADQLKNRRNLASEEMTRLKNDRQPTDSLLAEMKQTSERIKQLDDQSRELNEQLQVRLLDLPNLLHDSVPAGRDEKENKEIKQWGRRSTFDFPVRSHWEIGEDLGILDFERAARVTG
ncbi:MAG: serine--tRNA ligase, partial [Nitrospirae bacterium]|nr:serine--tRNA ligase [Nitrospirota bacterium]